MDELDERMTASEEALREHHDFWVQHVEATLGPIRDESQRLWDALKEEIGARQLQDQQRVAWLLSRRFAIVYKISIGSL